MTGANAPFKPPWAAAAPGAVASAATRAAVTDTAVDELPSTDGSAPSGTMNVTATTDDTTSAPAIEDDIMLNPITRHVLKHYSN